MKELGHAEALGHPLRDEIRGCGRREPAASRRRVQRARRLADGSFVHVSFHDHGEDEVNPISSTPAFAHFQDGHGDRREGGVDQQTATLVGAYVTVID